MRSELALRAFQINRALLNARASGACMLSYRFLTGEDDAAFCHRVTKALSEGWQLYGTPSYAYDAHNKKMKVGQAVTRIAADQPYDPDKKLVDF